MFFSPTVIATSGGLIAILTLIVFINQNILIKEQNRYFNRQIIESNIRYYRQQVFSESHNKKNKVEVLNSLISEYDKLYPNKKNINIMVSGANFKNCSLKNDTNSYLNIDFTSCDFSNSSLLNLNLNGSDFSNSNFNPTHYFEKNEMQFSEIIGCNLKNVIFDNTDLKYVDFSNSDFDGVQFNWNSQKKLINNTIFINIKNAPVGFIQKAKKYGGITSIKELNLAITNLKIDSVYFIKNNKLEKKTGFDINIPS